MIGQVVVGIDGSAHSLSAFQYAVDLARRAKATIVPMAIEGAHDVWPRGSSLPHLRGR